MKIGIVSAQKHCKTHLRQLTKDGHEVYCLGGRPSKIPPSYDVLIVRIASMRHTDSYKHWHKETGRPVIYEDGLSGMRRELAKIEAQIVPRPKAVPTAAISVGDVRREMLEWGKALMEARPGDRRGDVSRHLTQTLYDQFPSMAADSKALVASVVGELFAAPSFAVPAPEAASATPEPTPTTPEPTEAPVTQEATPMPEYPTQSVPWETVKATEKWCKVYTPTKLNKAWERAQRMITTDLTDRQQDKFVAAWKSRAEKGNPIQRDLVRALNPLVSGKPLAFVMFVYLVLPEGYKVRKASLYEVYKQITNKGSDTRLSYAVEWYLNLGIETTAMPEAMVVDPPEEAAPPAPANGAATPLPQALLKVAPRDDAAVDGNTQAILEIMEDVASLKDKLSALESKAPSTAPASGAWVKDVVAEAVAAMREELRSDLADAFASLAAEQPSGNVSSNPLAALEQVKAALKAAGFKGTLTLTIE